LKQTPIKEIAKSPKARFEWWVQTKFNVLPTDSRYIDLTEEQLDLMWEHYLIDNPPPEPQGIQDTEYDKAEADTDGYEVPDEEIQDKEHRLPLANEEHFEDPDFDAEWNAEDEEDDSDIVGENSSEEDFQSVGDEEMVDTGVSIDFGNDDEWKEV
jgi:hypothetical protein